MKSGKNLMIAAGAAALAGAMLPAYADSDNALGVPLYAEGGGVTLRFEGSNAGYDSVISVNGSLEVFPNHGTAAGPSSDIDLGSYTEGSAIDVMLHVLDTGNFFHTGWGAANPDGLAHAVISQSGDRTFVSFEDLLGGGDLDYNDHRFSLSGVRVAEVPEPAALAMLLAGLGVVGFVGRRRRPD
jgi:hypothetical protein